MQQYHLSFSLKSSNLNGRLLSTTILNHQTIQAQSVGDALNKAYNITQENPAIQNANPAHYAKGALNINSIETNLYISIVGPNIHSEYSYKTIEENFLRIARASTITWMADEERTPSN